MSTEYARFKRLYNEGRLTQEGLAKAVAKGLLTQEEMDEIVRGN